MNESDRQIVTLVKATQPFGFFVVEMSFHVNRDFSPILNKESLVLGGENSLSNEMVKFRASRDDAETIDVVRFFTNHKASLSLKPVHDDDEVESTSSVIATANLVLGAEYKLLEPVDDELLGALAAHCAMTHAYPYAREIMQTNFQRAGFSNVTLPFLNRALTGKVALQGECESGQ